MCINEKESQNSPECQDNSNTISTTTAFFVFVAISLFSWVFYSTIFLVMIRSGRRKKRGLNINDIEQIALEKTEKEQEKQTKELRKTLDELYVTVPNEIYLKDELNAEASALLERKSTPHVSFRRTSSHVSDASRDASQVFATEGARYSRRDSELWMQQLSRALFVEPDSDSCDSNIGLENSSNSGVTPRTKKMSTLIRRRRTSPDIGSTLANAFLSESRELMLGSQESLRSIGTSNSAIRTTASKSLSRIVVESRLVQRLRDGSELELDRQRKNSKVFVTRRSLRRPGEHF